MLSGSLRYANRPVYTERPDAVARFRLVLKPCNRPQMFAWLGFQRRSDCTSIPNCTGTLWPVRGPRVHLLFTVFVLAVKRLLSCQVVRLVRDQTLALVPPPRPAALQVLLLWQTSLFSLRANPQCCSIDPGPAPARPQLTSHSCSIHCSSRVQSPICLTQTR